MTKKSSGRQARDAQLAAHGNRAAARTVAQRAAKPAPLTWEEPLSVNNHVKEILSMVKPHIDQAKQSAANGLAAFSPNINLLTTAFQNVEDEFKAINERNDQLRATIGDRKGKITDPNVAMEVLDIYMKHQEVATQLDTTFRPNLAILEEQLKGAMARQMDYENGKLTEQEILEVNTKLERLRANQAAIQQAAQEQPVAG